jgi:hypothetical protein
MRQHRGFLRAVLVACSLVSAQVAGADTIRLKDGRVVEGTIVREEAGYVWIKTTVAGVPREEMFSVGDQVQAIVRTTNAPVLASGTIPPTPDVEDELIPDKKPGEVRGVVLTLGDRENNMVGMYMVSSVLREAIPILEKEIGTDHTGVVVLRITSGGGAIVEIQRLSDVIHEEFKPRWRTVGWIETAISAAAMTAHCLEEIYFTSEGNYGACTAFAGSLDRPVEGLALERVLAMMECISARGGYNPLIMRAMQIQQPLSATVLPSGEVKWYPDATSGEILVNREREILTFDYRLANQVRFSRGVANTTDELAAAMGLKEIRWMGKDVPGVPWKVSRAERRQMDFRKQTRNDQDNLGNWYNLYQTNLGVAAQMPRDERGPWLGKARQYLDRIKGMIRNNPNLALFQFGGREQYEEWLKEQERRIAELARK